MSTITTERKTGSHGKRRLAVGLAGGCLLLSGLLCGIFWGTMINSLLDKAMTLRPNSLIFEYWKTPPLEIGVDMYLFNWTNPEDFNNLTTKPIFKELGPYRFIEKPNKVDIRWHPENASVSYRRKSMYEFDAAGSVGSLSDLIVTINPVAVTAAGKAKGWNAVKRGVIDIALRIYGNDISVTKTVDELLFSGYDDVLLDVVNAVPTLISDIEAPFDKFGYCYTRNGSSTFTGSYNIYTGADDISKIGRMHTWNYKTHTGKFDSFCGMVNGSAGEFEPPNLTENSTTHIFIPEICRTIPLEYADTVEVEGVKGFKYVGGLRAVDNGTLYPENKCFCGGQCGPSGLMNISSCWFDAPLFMSYPHFYNADPSYLDAVEGLHPKKEDHELYVILEPRTGFALEMAGRLQLNIFVEPLPYLDLFKKVPRIFFPLMWFEERVSITPELAADLRLLPIVLLVGKVVAGISVVVGLGLMAWFRMEQYLNAARSIDLKLCLDEGKVVKTQYSTPQGSPIFERTILRDERTKKMVQSTSIDSGYPNVDSTSHSSATNIVGCVTPDRDEMQ